MEVSVIVPTYRRDHALARALMSLANQDFSDFEVIVVDDNQHNQWSRKVRDIISDIKTQYPELEIKYLQNQVRMGSAMARNMGAQKASGKYLTFLDDDDEYLKERIKRQYQFMVANQLDYSITDLDLYFENGRLSERRIRAYIEKTDSFSLLRYHLMYHMTGTDTIMITKAYFDQIGGFPPIDVGDEFYLMLRAIERNGKFGYLPGCDVRAYVHTGETGLSSGKGKIEGENQVYQHKKQYFSLLDAQSVRYIKMRHYAVLCFAGLRMHNYRYFLQYGFLGFCFAPLQCLEMLVRQMENMRLTLLR